MHDQTAKTDQNHHENKIRMRTLIDEVKALKEHKEAAETVEMNQHDNIDVIVSHTLTDGARLVSSHPKANSSSPQKSSRVTQSPKFPKENYLDDSLAPL